MKKYKATNKHDIKNEQNKQRQAKQSKKHNIV